MKPLRPKQDTTSDKARELAEAVLAKIRGQWYGPRPADDLRRPTPDDWWKDRSFILNRVVLWPASWLNKRGLTLATERYFEIVITKLNDVHAKHEQESFTYLPGYLMKCMQDHFKHHGDKIHDEAKSFTAAVEAAIGTAKAAPAADPIRAMDAARAFVSTKRNTKATQFKAGEQDLFSHD